MTHTATDPIRHALSTILGWFAREWEAKSQSDLMKALDQQELEQIAEDCGISRGQLLAFIEAGPHGADEMPRMMRALNIDPIEVEFRMLRLYRDMQLTCITCGAKAQCRKDLAEGHAATEFQHYCGNIDTLNALRARPEMLLEA
ncbi:hypothetical protein FE840_011350 [Peteryoungia desertarenae]|uniref:DUF6455 domain-containing protein n=2 Tax=Peteryoungia desertarenae TaxID=1813451 RepID=A0ABX6QSA4_9HYPH|nr:hypothetical protein FE840_011350 [Peteryoungia desertarenae]